MPDSASMSIDWPRFCSVIRAAKRIILTSHIRPDCDALGSELGMALVLEALGKQVMIVNAHETPPNLAFIDPAKKLGVLNKTVPPSRLAECDLWMVLDTSAWAQLGDMGEAMKAFTGKKIVLDHHVGEDDLGAEWFKNTKAEAAGRLVVEAAEHLGVALTPAMAMPLFAAVATDTGWFRFNSISEETFRVGGKLLAAGAKPDDIYRELYERNTVGRIRLRGVILARIATELGGRLAYTMVLKQDFAATGALPSDTEDAVNTLLSIEGTEVAVIFVEQAAGGFKISFRSRSAVDCNLLAKRFGGGGHKAAAGALIPGLLEEVRPQVLDAVLAAMA